MRINHKYMKNENFRQITPTETAFNNLPSEMIESLRGKGFDFPYHKLDKVSPDLHQQIADRLVTMGCGAYVLSNLDQFQNVNHAKILNDILKRGETHLITHDTIRHIQGLTQREIAEMVRQHRQEEKRTLQQAEIPRPPIPMDSLVKRVLRKISPEPSTPSTTLADIKKILTNDGLREVDFENSEPVIEALLKLFSDKINWNDFFSQELCETQFGDFRTHHYEVVQMAWLYKHLKHFYTDEDVDKLLSECPLTNAVNFVEAFLEKGKQRIIEALTKQQSKYFEVTPESNIWRYGNTAEMTMEDYLGHCRDQAQSSGRFLVHVVKDHLFEKLLKKPRLTPSALLHIQEHDDVSRQLDKNRDTYGREVVKTYGLSVGVHFSFDDKVEYPEGKFACVFAAETLFNNYAYLERDDQSENDIVIGGMSNDYLNDPSHQVNVLKYGFFLVPEYYKGKLENAAKKTRIFYYQGSLTDGLQQLREFVGQAQPKVKLARSLKFKRRIGAKHALENNTSFYAQTTIQTQLEQAAKEWEKGNNIYPSDDFMLHHIGKGGGKGNYFSV